jgi:hypothetical protein
MKLCKGKLCKSVPGAGKKKVVKFNRMMHKKSVELVRDGKYYMKVGNGKKITFTVFDPCFALGVLAFRTMTVTTGVIADANVPAMIAPVNMAA